MVVAGQQISMTTICARSGFCRDRRIENKKKIVFFDSHGPMKMLVWQLATRCLKPLIFAWLAWSWPCSLGCWPEPSYVVFGQFQPIAWRNWLSFCFFHNFLPSSIRRGNKSSSQTVLVIWLLMIYLFCLFLSLFLDDWLIWDKQKMVVVSKEKKCTLIVVKLVYGSIQQRFFPEIFRWHLVFQQNGGGNNF